MNIPSHEMRVLLKILITGARHGILRMINYMDDWLSGNLKDEFK